MMTRERNFQHKGLNFNAVESAHAGVPVVFQHGLCGNAAQTAEVFPEDSRFRMQTLECRGHGRSDAGDAAGFGIAAFAGDVAAYMTASKIVACIVGGISMGAAMALHLAVHRPEMVKALVIARPAWLLDPHPINCQANVEVGELLARFAPDEAKARFLQTPTARHLTEKAPDNLASLLGFFHREPIAVTSALLTAIARDGPQVSEAEVCALKMPTLIIATAQDEIHPLSHAHALNEMIAGSHLKIITSKVENRQQYVTEFRQALSTFFEENI